MPLTNVLALLFFLLAIWIFAMVDSVQALSTNTEIGYGALRPDLAAGSIAVGSSVTTDSASSWTSSSGRFAFGFHFEKGGFFVAIQLLASPSETVVVWTARPPDPKGFTKDAFLNFTDKGLFVTPEKDGKAFPLFTFSSTATSATMLDDGNFVVFNSNGQSSCNSYSRCSTGVGDRGQPYNRPCSKVSTCKSSSSNNIIWRSFDSPTDTILGSQILPCRYNLTSSAGETDHSIGQYVLNLPCGGGNLVFFRLNSADKIWENGPSAGVYTFLNLDRNGRLYLTSSNGNLQDVSAYKPNATTTDEMLYRATLDHDGIFRLKELNLVANLTNVVNEIPYYQNKCQIKDSCGVNSYCFVANGDPQCSCMPGFEYINPKSQPAGCRRTKPLPSCLAASAIPSMEAVENIVGMDEHAYGLLSTESQEECRNACLSDCNCDAASFVNQNCLKLKLPLTSGREDKNHPSVALIKLAGEVAPQLAAAGQQRKRKIRFGAIFMSAAAVIFIWIVVIGAFLGAYWFLFGRFRKEWRKWELALTEEIAPRYFSYEEILKGSNEFKQQLGKGGYGTVFRADLLIGGLTVAVAVKKLHGAEAEGEREFQAEMRLIGRASHTNLVRLIGFCHDGRSRLIVYELMSRGSLADHIFEATKRPSWERRVAILLHAARGIHYLHCECESKIIHRDIKPENILIAVDWTAKISDFGIAKLLNRNQTRAATRTRAAGTEGYIAPECEEAADGSGEVEVTEKADVYSYGIVVLQTICCKRNREEKPSSLSEWVRKSYEENELWKLLDGEQVEEFQLEKLVKVGLLCVQKDPNARPMMEDVVMMLEGCIDVPTFSPVSLSL